MAPTDGELKSLKDKRSSAKRRVTIAYNILEPIVAEGVLKDKSQYDRLLQEYTLFEVAYDNYVEALEDRADRDDQADFTNLGSYLKEVNDKVEDIKSKIWFSEAEEKFDKDNQNYELAKAAVMGIVGRVTDKSVEELREDSRSQVQLESLNAKFPEMRRCYDLLRDSVRDFIKACKRTHRNQNVELERCNFVASPEDLDKANEAIEKLKEAVMMIEEKKEAAASVARERAQAADNRQRPRNDGMKLEKVESVKFDGEYRNYASFVRRFKLVVYPDRAASDIGVRLQQALPARFKHLLENHDLDDYEGMLETLDKKFGKHKHIVSSCVSEIELMKKPNSDETYITMVEKLEKIQTDLKAIDVGSKLDHEEIIGKIEERLPDKVRMKWSSTALSSGCWIRRTPGACLTRY